MQKYREAVKDLRLAQSSDTAAGQITRKAVYLIGVCFLETGDVQAAGNQFDRNWTSCLRERPRPSPPRCKGRSWRGSRDITIWRW